MNFLLIEEIEKMKLINKYYEDFINNYFILENYDHPKVNVEIIKKYAIYLKKIVSYDKDNMLRDEHLENCTRLETLSVSRGSYITNSGLINIPNIKILMLPYNRKITDKGLKYIQNIRILDIQCNKNITDKGLEYIPNVKYLRLKKKISQIKD